MFVGNVDIGDAWRNSCAMIIVSFLGLSQFCYHFCGVLCQVSNHFNSSASDIIYWINWYFRLASHFWIFSLLMMLIHFGPVYYHRSNLDKRFMILIHCVSWILPLIVTIFIAIISKKEDIDDIDSWPCGILYQYQSFILLFLQLMFAVILVCGIIYFHIPKSYDLQDNDGKQDCLLNGNGGKQIDMKNEYLYLEIGNKDEIDYHAKYLGNIVGRVEPSSRDVETPDLISIKCTPGKRAVGNVKDMNVDLNDLNDLDLDLHLSNEEIAAQQKAYIAMTQMIKKQQQEDQQHEDNVSIVQLSTNAKKSQENVNYNYNKYIKPSRASYNTTLSSDLYDKPADYDSRFDHDTTRTTTNINMYDKPSRYESQHFSNNNRNGNKRGAAGVGAGLGAHHHNMDTLQQLRYANDNAARSMTDSSLLTPQSTIRGGARSRNESSFNNDNDAKLMEIGDEDAYSTPGCGNGVDGDGRDKADTVTTNAGTVIIKDTQDLYDDDDTTTIRTIGTTRTSMETAATTNYKYYKNSKNSKNPQNSRRKSNGTVETNFSDPVIHDIKTELNRIENIENESNQNNNNNNNNKNNIDMNGKNSGTMSTGIDSDDVTLSTVKMSKNELKLNQGSKMSRSDSKLSLMPLKANEVNAQGIETWKSVHASQLTSHFYVATMVVLLCM